MQIKATIIVLAITVLPGFALAQATRGERIDERQAAQQKRIDDGVKKGELTPEEAARLRADQARIQRMEDKARADGKIDRREARDIERAQRRETRDIATERKDNEKVTPAERDKAGKRIDERQAVQQKRIDDGVKKGELTPQEAARLRADQARIQRMEDKARADGKIDRREARDIERAQRRETRDIATERRDQEKVTPAERDKAGKRIDERQAVQQKRIDDGVKKGELTPQEAARLRADQARIQRMEDKARADGKIDRREARDIERAQRRESRDIRSERRDKEKVVK